MTERLYYRDAYAREFDAAVVGVDAVSKRPGHFAAVLDRTAFYPTSGGQPFDTGILGTARVVDVVDADDGRIVHVVEGTIAAGPVHGAIDWPRRFEHMQQHTGQHVLSAAFDRLVQVQTVSFHLGTSSSTIDLAREVSADEIARAEAEANRVVWENRPVTIRFANADEVAALPLRKESKREGVLRLVDVEDFDVSACGGTHVARTGAIGIIAVAAFEKFKGGTRLEFLSGGRALAGYHSLRDAVAASVRLLSVLPAELPAAIDRGQTDARDLRRQVKDSADTARWTRSQRAGGARGAGWGGPRGPRRARRWRRMGCQRPQVDRDCDCCAAGARGRPPQRANTVGDCHRASAGCRARQRGDPQAAHSNVWRERWRPSGACAGWRVEW